MKAILFFWAHVWNLWNRAYKRLCHWLLGGRQKSLHRSTADEDRGTFAFGWSTLALVFRYEFWSVWFLWEWRRKWRRRKRSMSKKWRTKLLEFTSKAKRRKQPLRQSEESNISRSRRPLQNTVLRGSPQRIYYSNASVVEKLGVKKVKYRTPISDLHSNFSIWLGFVLSFWQEMTFKGFFFFFFTFLCIKMVSVSCILPTDHFSFFLFFLYVLCIGSVLNGSNSTISSAVCLPILWENKPGFSPKEFVFGEWVSY